MAPEVLGLLEDDYNYTEAVDIWSLGCLLYKILTGEAPFTWMPHLPLEKYVKGQTSFPEQLLLERGISIDGRSCIAKMLRPLPKMRSLASGTLIDEWIVPQVAEVPMKKAGSTSLSQPSTSPEDLPQYKRTGSLQPTGSTYDMSTKPDTRLSIEEPGPKKEMVSEPRISFISRILTQTTRIICPSSFGAKWKGKDGPNMVMRDLKVSSTPGQIQI